MCWNDSAKLLQQHNQGGGADTAASTESPSVVEAKSKAFQITMDHDQGIDMTLVKKIISI